MKQRLSSIIQLSFLFSFLSWHAMQPFVKETLTIKHKELLYQNLTGEHPLLEKPNLFQSLHEESPIPTFQADPLPFSTKLSQYKIIWIRTDHFEFF